MQMWSHEYFVSTQVVKGELGKEQPQRGKYLLFVDICANLLNTVMYANLRKCKKKNNQPTKKNKINECRQEHRKDYQPKKTKTYG